MLLSTENTDLEEQLMMDSRSKCPLFKTVEIYQNLMILFTPTLGQHLFSTLTFWVLIPQLQVELLQRDTIIWKL